jgi:hypothetical protein
VETLDLVETESGEMVGGGGGVGTERDGGREGKGRAGERGGGVARKRGEIGESVGRETKMNVEWRTNV